MNLFPRSRMSLSSTFSPRQFQTNRALFTQPHVPIEGKGHFSPRLLHQVPGERLPCHRARRAYRLFGFQLGRASGAHTPVLRG